MEDEQQHYVHAELPLHTQYDRDRLEYELTMRQEPKQARMCGVGADRRPIDPPPIIQLRVIDPSQRRHQTDSRSSSPDPTASLASQSFLQNPYYFMFASLAKPDEDVELHWLKDGKTRCTTGSVVSSLYHLKDTESGGADAGFFVFPDLSVRTEGSYRLKLSLYEVVGSNVYHCKSIFSAPFYVYTAKKFPGMEESTPLSCSLADQGIKIRIRKDIRNRKRPIQGLGETPIPLPMAGAPPPPGAFGPVPVRLDDPEPEDDHRHLDEARDRSTIPPPPPSLPEPPRDAARDFARRGSESERESPREEPRKLTNRRSSGATGTGSESERRASGSLSERSVKRARGDDGGSIHINTAAAGNAGHGPATHAHEVSPHSAGPSSWVPMDASSLGSAPQASPAAQTLPPTSAGTDHHHYAPAPVAGPYDHRYSAAPAQASIAAPAPAPGASPTASYHYDPHAHAHPVSGSAASPTSAAPAPAHHYAANPLPPHTYAHVPPPVHTHHASYGYPPAPAAAAAPGQQAWYDPYHYSIPQASHHHAHAPQHHAAPPPPPRYGEYPASAPSYGAPPATAPAPAPASAPGAAQSYGYYDHAPAPPPQHYQHQPQQHHVPPAPSHHTYQQHHPNYAPPAPATPPSATAPAPSAMHYDYTTPPNTSEGRQPQVASQSPTSSRGYYTSAPTSASVAANSTAHATHYPYPSSYAPSAGPSQSQAQNAGHSPTTGTAHGGARGPYQLSTPPHHHQGQAYSAGYPPAPGSSPVSAGAGGEGTWAYPAQGSSASTWGVGGSGVMMQAGAYGHYGANPGGRDAHGRIQLAPLRQGTPPPGSGERSAGSSGKKNPLSIGNIISGDSR